MLNPDLRREPPSRGERQRERTWGRALALVTLALVLATAIGMALLWPGGFELAAAPGTPTGDPRRGEVTEVRSVPCQVPEQKGCRIATAKLRGVGGPAQFPLQSGASGLAGPATSSNGADPGDRRRVGLGAAP